MYSPVALASYIHVLHITMSGKEQILTRAVRALQSFLPEKTPPSLDTRAGNLYQVLSRHPNDGIGLKVHQTRWAEKGIPRSYWRVTRTNLKCEGQHGKAWGRLYWKGNSPTTHPFVVPRVRSSTSALSNKHVLGKSTLGEEEKIPGSLKYKWRTGPSRIPPALRQRS